MIKKAEIKDCEVLATLAVKMWKEHLIDELALEFKEIIESDSSVCFIKYYNDQAIGFAQCSLRTDYVEGTETTPVAYLEGAFIEENYRNNGYAKELIKECEKWAKSKKCTEFASDCDLDNIDSLKFHLASGFNEVNRIICFKKDLK